MKPAISPSLWQNRNVSRPSECHFPHHFPHAAEIGKALDSFVHPKAGFYISYYKNTVQAWDGKYLASPHFFPTLVLYDPSCMLCTVCCLDLGFSQRGREHAIVGHVGAGYFSNGSIYKTLSLDFNKWYVVHPRWVLIIILQPFQCSDRVLIMWIPCTTVYAACGWGGGGYGVGTYYVHVCISKYPATQWQSLPKWTVNMHTVKHA
jgi:hypothetical protein